MTHEVGVACMEPYATVYVRIGNLYGWKECSDNFLHTVTLTIKVRMGWKSHVKLTQDCQQSYEKKIVQNLKILIFSVISQVKVSACDTWSGGSSWSPMQLCMSEYVIYMAGKSIVAISFIITQLLKLEWGEKLVWS